MKHFLICVLIFWVFLVWQIFFAPSNHPTISTGPAASDRIEIVFWHAMGGELGKVMDSMVEEYNAYSKTYRIKAVNMGGYDTLQKKLLASLIAEEAPDISQNYETLTKKFIKHQKIVCIDDLIKKDVENGGEDVRKDIVPVMLRNNTYEGKLYSFPFNKSLPVLYYNKNIFKQVGLDPERPPQTYEELEEYCQKITDYYRDGKGDSPDDRDIYGYGCTKGNVWSFLNRLKAFGGTIAKRNSDGVMECGFNSEAAIKSLDVLLRMLKKGVAKESQGFDHQTDFEHGKAAIIEASIVSKVYMEARLKRFKYGIAPLPGVKLNGQNGEIHHGAILSGSNINIFNNGDEKKIAGAWNFVKWFTSTENGAKWSIGTTYMPVRVSSVEGPVITAARQKDPNLNATYVQLSSCSFEPRLTAWFEIRDMIADFLEEATLKKLDPADCCKRMTKDVNAILRHVTDNDDALE